jgi:hypothetical protein
LDGTNAEKTRRDAGTHAKAYCTYAVGSSEGKEHKEGQVPQVEN